MNALRRIVRELRLSAIGVEKRTGLSGAQLFVLHCLRDAEAPSIGELAALTRTDPSSVSVVVNRLVERGLASRRTSEADARRAEIVLTARGRRLAQKAPEPAQVRLVDALDHMAPAPRRALAAGMAALLAGMGIVDVEPALFFFEESPRRRARKAPAARGARS